MTDGNYIMRASFFAFFFFNILMASFNLHAQTSDCNTEKSSTENKEEKPEESKEEKVTEKKEEKPAEKDEKASEGKEEPEKKDEKPEEKKEEKPPSIGNFALPTSQQPAALFGFGGNIIDANEVQLYFFADALCGREKLTTDLIPSVLFGITDNWSIFFNFPFSPKMIDGCHQSSGLEDFFIQLEYAFYNKSTRKYVDQATVVANITFPTGSIKKDPPTGFGSPSLFLGGTYYRTYVDWFVFVAPGAVLTTSEHGTKVGDQFLYQFGVGRNIPSPKGTIGAWMVEVDGQYNKKNRVKGKIDPNSGGNTIYVTPSLWFSTKEMLVQAGVSFPVNQHLFGKQHKFQYVFNFNFAWSFY